MSYMSQFSGACVLGTSITTNANCFVYKYGNPYITKIWTSDNFKDQI